jgi:histidinol-phosphate aminotransferase
MTPDQLIPASIRDMKAYKVQDATGLRKLDAMENPWHWPDELMDRLADTIRAVEINRYPSPSADALRQAIAGHFGLSKAYDLLLGNGSDELIQMLIMAVAASGRPVMGVAPSFVMYEVISRWLSVPYVSVDLAQDFSLDTQAMLEAMVEHRPAILFLACPNNPTGNLFDEQALRQLIEAAPGLVVIDEAYTAFSCRSHLSWLGDYDNLLVMRTLSKVGLAGLRVGMLFGRPDWLCEFDKVRLPYNLNALSQVAARLALDSYEVFDAQTKVLKAERASLASLLSDVPGLTPLPSEANFILLRTPLGQATALFEHLLREGILVKNLDGGHPLLHDCLRLTIGTPEDNQMLYAAIRAFQG